MSKIIIPIFVAIAALAAGAYSGYVYGVSKGQEQGRAALLAEQAVAKQAEAAQAQEQITQEANPFKAEEEAVNPFAEQQETVNPFGDGYVNPFSQ